MSVNEPITVILKWIEEEEEENDEDDDELMYLHRNRLIDIFVCLQIIIKIRNIENYNKIMKSNRKRTFIIFQVLYTLACTRYKII